MRGTETRAGLVAMVALACAACGARPAPSTAVAPVAAQEPPSAPPPEPEPATPDLTPQLTALVAERLPDAQVTAVVPEEDGGWVTVAWHAFVLRLSYAGDPPRLSERAIRAIEGARFLHELEEAGVVLSRTGAALATEADGALQCAIDPSAEEEVYVCRAADEPEGSSAPAPVTLEPAEWMLPPSRRPRSRAPGARRGARRGRAPRRVASATTERIAAVLAPRFGWGVTGVPIDASHRALLVAADEASDFPGGVLVCVTTTGEGAPAVHCAATELEVLEGVVVASESRWLLAAQSSYGLPRSASRFLVSLLWTEGGLVEDILSLGGMDGEGYGCEDVDSYCVDVRGEWARAQVVSDGCVELRPEGRWTATHVRVGDRWIHEAIDPAPGCVHRWAIREGRFARAECGPRPSEPVCPSEERRAP